VQGQPTPPAGDEDPVVYVVDDDAQLCASLAWLLGSVGLQASCFHDARSFLAAYDATRLGCVVLDVRIPDTSGFDLQSVLTEMGSDLPVVFMSAHGDIPMSVRAMQAGAVEFLEKPYNPQHMLEVVQRALRSARADRARSAARRALQKRLAALTEREREVLDLVIEGRVSKEIAGRLGISVKTVDVHRTRIREKTGAENLTTLVRDIVLHGGWSPDGNRP
jgi:two-component system, LuxR family, response regulator FixJ